MSENSRTFYQSLFALIFAALCFLVFKAYLPKRIFPESKAQGTHIAADSTLIEAMTDTLDTVALDSAAMAPAEVSDSGLIQYTANDDGILFPPEQSDLYTGYHYLIPFFEKLHDLQTTGKGNIRIAYFGDSQTDGDMIVQDFRTIMQDRYGGNGVGFVPIASE